MNTGDTGGGGENLQRSQVLTANVGNGELFEVREELEGGNDAAVERATDAEDEGDKTGASGEESDGGV